MEITYVDSQEQIRQLTSNENMIDYCQFTMQNLMGCHEIVGGLKGNCIIKSICLKNITGDQSYIYIYIFIVLLYAFIIYKIFRK